MKCRHCNNQLPATRGFSKVSSRGKIIPGKIACCKEGCISFGLKPGSKDFQEYVMGRDRQDVEERWKSRIEKSTLTNQLLGNFSGDKNPASKRRLKDKGLSDTDIQEKLSIKSKKSSKTKRDSGFYEDKSNNPYALEFWIKEGLNKDQAKEKINSRMHNRPEFWIKKGYSPEESRILAAQSAATNSLSEKIKRWGDDGQLKYLEVRKKLSENWSPRSSTGKNFSSSKQANTFFKKLYKFCRRLGYSKDDFVFKLNKGEWFLRDGDNIYFYDFLIKPLRIIVEFNGEHVHPNKNKLSKEEWNSWRHAFSKKTADEVSEYDSNKVLLAKKAGYNVTQVWSKDAAAFEDTVNFIKGIHHGNQNLKA